MRKSPYYLSQYLWVFYIAIPIIFSIIFPQKQKRVTIHSSHHFINNSKDPIVFAHVTDSHINNIIPDHLLSYKQVINLLKYSSPEFIVHTGDMVDNYDSLTMLRYGDQNEKDWKTYELETSNINQIPIIEVGGNHDMFGIKSALSKKNFILDYSRSFSRNNTKTEDEFTIHSFQMEPSNINVIALNPFHFPTAHPPLLLYTRYKKNILIELKKKLKRVLQNV